MAIRNGICAGALIAGLFAANLSHAQDVKVFSREQAQEALAGEPDNGSADGDCPRLPNGQCAKIAGGERAFSLSKGNTAKPAATAGRASVTGSRPSSATAYAPSRGRAQVGRTARPTARPTEVPLQFKLGSTELSPQSRANLKTLASVLNDSANRGKRVQITGHTDKSGSFETNQRLSKQRAEAAAAFLVEQGVDRTRLDAQGRGFDSPLPNLSAFDPRNRRVEVLRVQ